MLLGERERERLESKLCALENENFVLKQKLEYQKELFRQTNLEKVLISNEHEITSERQFHFERRSSSPAGPCES